MKYVVIVVLVLIVGCGDKKSSSTHASKIRDAMKEMAGRPAEQRQAFAAAALAELVGAKLPAGLREAFDELDSVAPEMRRLVLARALTDAEVVVVWMKICPGGLRVFAGMAQLPRDEHGEHLWETCPLDGSGLVDAARAARTDGGALAIGLITATMVSSGIERDLVKYFLDASPSAP